MNLINRVKSPVLKKNITGYKNKAGKNNSGRITVRHRGGGHKKRYRNITFNRSLSSEGILINVEYDPNRTSFIGAIYDYINFKYFYIILPKNLKIGNVVKSGESSDIKLGNSIQISKIPIGSYIHNISLRKSSKGILSRSAGTFSTIIEKFSNFTRIKLSSGEQRLIPNYCYATLGTVSNESFFTKKLGKAGRSRWLNKRPTVRGVAMNPVDHPHGGGEGKTSGGKIKLTPWGKPTINKPTVKYINPLIIDKRKKR